MLLKLHPVITKAKIRIRRTITTTNQEEEMNNKIEKDITTMEEEDLEAGEMAEEVPGMEEFNVKSAGNLDIRPDNVIIGLIRIMEDLHHITSRRTI